MVSQEILDEIVRRLVSKFKPEKIILFGSQARGMADDKSDVDILVLSPFDGDRFDLMHEMDEELMEISYAFDIIVLTTKEFEIDRNIPGTIARYASKEGKVLYDR
jgi:uncharacterized protein